MPTHWFVSEDWKCNNMCREHGHLFVPHERWRRWTCSRHIMNSTWREHVHLLHYSSGRETELHHCFFINIICRVVNHSLWGTVSNNKITALVFVDDTVIQAFRYCVSRRRYVLVWVFISLLNDRVQCIHGCEMNIKKKPEWHHNP